MAFRATRKRRILKERPIYEVELDAEGIRQLEEWLQGLPEGPVLLTLKGQEFELETVRERSLLARGVALGYQMAHKKVSESLDLLAPPWVEETVEEEDAEDPEITLDLSIEDPKE